MQNPFRAKAIQFFKESDQAQIVQTIQNIELKTSGEVRVFIENKCRFMNALDRASEIFFQLKMEKTELRNGILLYIAIKDRQLAIYGDEGISCKLPSSFWKATLDALVTHFQDKKYVVGIQEALVSIGKELEQIFPFNPLITKNELPDEIVFGSN